jgi:exosortase A-associated hydrolase 1
MNYHEKPLVFECGDCRLIGIASFPKQVSKIGVLIIVGGPQYRSGSHRQFTLLARHLAENGISSFRFDYRGMGDSEGKMRTFEDLNDDIRSAINAFFSISENVERIVIWGLCDAASATLYYAYTDSRVFGIVLLNPWVHTGVGAERARLKHYYLTRLLHKSFWLKLFSGQVNIINSSKEITKSINNLLMNKSSLKTSKSQCYLIENQSFIERMLAGLTSFSGQILMILSGNDLVSQEFQQLIQSNNDWKDACTSPRFEKIIIKEANHTFSTRFWRNQVNELTLNWLKNNINPIDR